MNLKRPIRRSSADSLLRRWSLRLFVVVSSAALSWLLAQLLAPEFASTAAIIGAICSALVGVLVDRLIGRYRAIIRQQNDRLAHQVSELERVNDLLSNRNTELRAFAQTVAHDLKSPLTVLLSNSELLALELDDLGPTELAEQAQELVESATTMRQIIDDLLLLASVRQAEVELRPLVMSTLIHKAQDRLRASLEACDATVLVSDDLPLAFGYAPWIEQVWVNLISNACKYGADGDGRVRFEIGGEGRGDRARYWIRDWGAGVASSQADELFQEFIRLQPQRCSGHGLGLWIVRRIVERLGGSVGVETDLGRGVRFFFELPTRREDQTTGRDAGVADATTRRDDASDLEVTARLRSA